MYIYIMAYRRKITRRRFTRRRPSRYTPWYNRKYTPAQMARSAWKGVQYIKNLVNSEVHKNDVHFNVTNVTAAGVVYANSSLIAIGDDYATRTGNSILCKSLSYNWLFSRTVADSMVRMIWFIDKQQIADTYPAVTDVLLTASPTSLLNPATVGRFSILRDYSFKLDTASQPLKVVKGGLVLKRHHMRYNGALSSDVQRGTIYMLVVGSADAGTFAGDLRLNFYDN